MQLPTRKKYQPRHLAKQKQRARRRGHLRSLLTIVFTLLTFSLMLGFVNAGYPVENEEPTTEIPVITPQPSNLITAATKSEIVNLKFNAAENPTEAISLTQNLVAYSKAPKAPLTLEEAEANFVFNLDWVKQNLHLWFTEDEIREVSLIVKAEAEVTNSETEWAACVWVILTRLNDPGFEQSDSIHGLLTAENQFSTYNARTLSAEENPAIRHIVIDVMARFILEEHGASEQMVGRVMPKTHRFWHANETYTYNIFYRYCWSDSYDPHSAPFNPYST